MLIDEIRRLGLPIEILSISHNPKSIDFLVTTLTDCPNLQIRMEPDNHPPHLHISVGNRAHCASFSLDGKFLPGDLDRRQIISVQKWISRHREKLNQLWNIVKRGEDYLPKVREIIWEDFKFDGERPPYHRIIEGVIIWYSGNLIENDLKDGVRGFTCTGDVHVVYPNKAKQHLYKFISEDGSIQERIMVTR